MVSAPLRGYVVAFSSQGRHCFCLQTNSLVGRPEVVGKLVGGGRRWVSETAGWTLVESSSSSSKPTSLCPNRSSQLLFFLCLGKERSWLSPRRSYLLHRLETNIDLWSIERKGPVERPRQREVTLTHSLVLSHSHCAFEKRHSQSVCFSFCRDGRCSSGTSYVCFGSD